MKTLNLHGYTLKQVDKTLWELPKSTNPDMRVPGLIVATEKLLSEMDKGVFMQAVNVATLKGIQRHAYVMPDAHWGYGFPIGGVAAMDVEEGVISPGGIGFDINCLPRDAKILHPLGYTKKIVEFEEDWKNEHLTTFDTSQDNLVETRIINFLKRKEEILFKIITKAGYTIKASGDHPILTKRGMVEAEKLLLGDRIAIYPFEGIEYAKPSNETILTGNDVLESDLGFNNEEILNELKKRELIPLTLDHPKLPILLKIFGYIIGNGSARIIDTREGKKTLVTFYGKPEDLEEIREDIRKLGWSTSRMHSQGIMARFLANDSTRSIDGKEYYLKLESSAFLQLFYMLGFPIENKSKQEWTLPSWIFKLEKWQKRLFLASYQGANMNVPNILAKKQEKFFSPHVKIHGKEPLQESGFQFMQDLQRLYKDLGIETTVTKPIISHVNARGENIHEIKLLINTTNENLHKFFATIGFCYNQEKSWISNALSFYLKLKASKKEKLASTIHEVQQIQETGNGHTNLLYVIDNKKKSFQEDVEKTLYAPSKGNPEPSREFLDLEEFITGHVIGNESESVFWDEIISIEIEEYNDYVYDFTVDHESHNFIADSVVVSNCGVRLIKTNLTLEEVKPKIKELVNELFRIVPAGVGSKGFLRLNQAEFREVMEMGVDWVIERGYGWEQDKERTEEFGRMEVADASKVSQKAIKRGIDQIGTLGSGNHYLEIQVARPHNYFDREIAKAMGLELDNQIVVMVHCGSRGFGHQIATDYLMKFLQVMPKYGIKIRDKELAAAPFNSPEGQDYYAAMAAAANMAWANRQVIMHRVREGFSRIFGMSPEDLEMELVYDVAHNIAKLEEYVVDGTKKTLLVHRKGATRSLGPGNKHLPPKYKDVGQPVLIGGSMETGSYLLVGTKKAEELTFGSTCHGSGRTMSRAAAKRKVKGYEVKRKMEQRGIYVKAVTLKGLAEEAGIAYKNISDVIDAVHQAGISKKVVRLEPIGNIKG